METALSQHVSTMLWGYYLFVQSDGTDWAQPALTVHSALAAAQLFEAAQHAGVLYTLCEELATYLHQCVGAPCQITRSVSLSDGLCASVIELRLLRPCNADTCNGCCVLALY